MNQEHFFFGLLQECLDHGVISETVLREEMAKNGIELVHMVRKGQLAPSGLGNPKAPAEQFYQLAA